MLEPELAYIAASTANEEDIERIKHAYDGMEKATTVEEFIEPDIQFHLAIAKATHNDLLAYMSKCWFYLCSNRFKSPVFAQIYKAIRYQDIKQF